MFMPEIGWTKGVGGQLSGRISGAARAALVQGDLISFLPAIISTLA